MSSGLGMSLDDYIKASKSKNRENNNFGGYKPKNSGGNFRKFRKFNQPQGNYNNRFKRDENYENKFNQKRSWEHDKYEDENKEFEYSKPQFNQEPQKIVTLSSRNTIRISNLHYAIINKDLHELFEQFGEITRCEIDWDEIGRSKGTAIIQFAEEESAKKAIEEYNGAELDGQKLVIELYKPVPVIKRPIQKDRFRNNNNNKGSFQTRKNFNRRFN